MAKGKKRRGAGGGFVENSEFPILARLGLYASNTIGDGNCLFRALSDQLYGFDGQYAVIRSRAIAYMQQNRDKFEAFVGEFGETFDQYVERLAQDGVYGGHMEIVATAWSYGVDINIYQGDSMYVIQNDGSAKEDDVPDQLSIAYHTWEHYSSVRNQTGPHSGPPEVTPTATEVVSEPVKVPRWKVEIVLRSVPDASESRIIKELETKDVGQVIEELLMAPDQDQDQDDQEQDQSKNQDKDEKEERAKSPGTTPTQTIASSSGPVLTSESGSSSTEPKPEKTKRQTARDRKEQARKQALERKLNKHKRRLGDSGTAPQSKEPAASEINPIYL